MADVGRQSEWGDIFGDNVMAAERIDGLVRDCHIVNIRGNSYRLRHHAVLHRVLGSPPSTPMENGTRGGGLARQVSCGVDATSSSLPG